MCGEDGIIIIQLFIIRRNEVEKKYKRLYIILLINAFLILILDFIDIDIQNESFSVNLFRQVDWI